MEIKTLDANTKYKVAVIWTEDGLSIGYCPEDSTYLHVGDLVEIDNGKQGKVLMVSDYCKVMEVENYVAALGTIGTVVKIEAIYRRSEVLWGEEQ